MKKQIIRLTEGDLHQIIENSVKRIIREMNDDDDEPAMWRVNYKKRPSSYVDIDEICQALLKYGEYKLDYDKKIILDYDSESPRGNEPYIYYEGVTRYIDNECLDDYDTFKEIITEIINDYYHPRQYRIDNVTQWKSEVKHE